jgi:hypothetical protein
MRMDRGDDEIEPAQSTVAQIEGPTLQDVYFDRRQRKVPQIRVELFDLINLPCEAFGIKPVRHLEALAVIGNRRIPIAKCLRGLCHGGNARHAITCVGVHMQLTTYVGELQQIWQPALTRGGDLVPTFSELRRNQR